MNNRLPLVSCITIVHNGEKYIREALTSIFSQTYPNIEVIVIDDGSTDNTKQEIESVGQPIRYYYHEKSGIAHSMNRGVNESNVQFLSFLDSDDLWDQTKTEKQVAYLMENPEIEACFGYAEEFKSPDLVQTQHAGLSKKHDSIPGYSSGTMLIRKSGFERIGTFDTQWKKGIFSDWFLRAKEKNLSMYLFEEVFLYRRIHDKNYGITHRDSYNDYVKMLKASLDRRRVNK